MDKVVSKTKYVRKEHRKFYFFHLTHRSSTIYFMLFFILVLAIITVVNIIKKENAVMSAILFGVTVGIIPILFIQKINEVIKQETPERLKSIDTIEVTKHKIVRSNDMTSGKAVIGWNNIDIICEEDEFIYIYNSDNTGLFIKKEDIVEGTLEDFRKIALDNVPKDKRGRPKYKRYGNVKKEYKKLLKLKKQEAKGKKK